MKIAVPGNAPITVPYAAHLFDAHFLRPPIDALASVRCGETHVVLRQPVQVDVAPAVGVDFLDGPYLVRWRTDATAQFDVLLTNNLPGTTTGTIVMSVSSGLQLDERAVPFELRGEGHQRVVPVKAEVKREVMPNDLYLSAMLEGEWTPHHAKVRVMDLKVPEGVHVGVVQSYDDTFVKTLGKMGVPHAALGIADFTPGRLDRFTTVLVDMRAYLVRDDLIANNQALLEYVERGGNVIVMYQKTFEWKEEYAPYPIDVSRNRVTVEEAPVEILAPDHPVFTRPNAITHQDWDGWIQERGLYFPDTWDERYTPLVACVDPGEDIPPGSWLVARYGDGTYMYTALGWYRQLRELHPGALRMFANMLAVGAASEPTATAEPGAAP